MNHQHERTAPDRQQGFVLLVMLAVLVPPIVLLGAFAATMVQRSSELGTQIEQERALFAAESGVDDAIFRGQTGTLVDHASYTLALGTGVSCDVVATHLKHDGRDNDGDGLIDEADEDVFQVVVTGHYRNTMRRVAAYLGPVPLLPTIDNAVLVSNRAATIDLRGSVQLSGNDVTLAGAATGARYPGMAIATPGTLADLNAQLTGAERGRVVGLGGPPSLAVTSPLDWPTLVPQLQNIADRVLTASAYSGLTVGSTSTWTPSIAYRNGDLRLTGNSAGVGILVVTGNLTLVGNVDWYGVILVLGNITQSAGTATVTGAMLQGPAGTLIDCRGTLTVRYSAAGCALANAATGRYVAFNGWQELGKP